jgi:hypothetical protein
MKAGDKLDMRSAKAMTIKAETTCNITSTGETTMVGSKINLNP